MPTLWLTIASMGWSVVFGLVIGTLSAVWRNRWPDRAGMTLLAIVAQGLRQAPLVPLGNQLARAQGLGGVHAHVQRRVV